MRYIAEEYGRQENCQEDMTENAPIFCFTVDIVFLFI